MNDSEKKEIQKIVESHKQELIVYIRQNIGLDIFLLIDIQLEDYTIVDHDTIFKFHCNITSPFESVERKCLVSLSAFRIDLILKKGIQWL